LSRSIAVLASSALLEIRHEDSRVGALICILIRLAWCSRNVAALLGVRYVSPV